MRQRLLTTLSGPRYAPYVRNRATKAGTVARCGATNTPIEAVAMSQLDSLLELWKWVMTAYLAAREAHAGFFSPIINC
jgi:hypothetical protein